MNRLWLGLLIVSCALSLSSEAGAIVYSLIDGAGGDQNGHSLSGFIEFDSVCGNGCTASDITDFYIEITGPSPGSRSYTGPADVISLLGMSNFDVTSSEILLDYNALGSLVLGYDPVTTATASVAWHGGIVVPGGGGVYEGTGAALNAWYESGIQGVVTIAAVVPEPSTSTLALVATVFYVVRRRSSVRRRAIQRR